MFVSICSNLHLYIVHWHCSYGTPCIMTLVYETPCILQAIWNLSTLIAAVIHRKYHLTALILQWFTFYWLDKKYILREWESRGKTWFPRSDQKVWCNFLDLQKTLKDYLKRLCYPGLDLVISVSLGHYFVISCWMIINCFNDCNLILIWTNCAEKWGSWD